MSPARKNNYSAVSLFSGCGGFCEGAKLAGFKVLAAVESDRFAAETYRHNFPDVPLFEETIEAFRMEGDPRWESEKSRFRALGSLDELDLVFGGPPCQGYSQIGTRDLNDPRNILYGEFVRVLYDLQPRAFLMENVPNMLMLAKGTFAEQALDALREAGYGNADVRVLPATDFGVPQLRKRAVFFGTRDDLDLPLPAGEWIERVVRLERQPETTVGQAIGDLPRLVSPDDSLLPYPRLRSVNPIRAELRLDTDGRYYSSSEKLARAGGELKLHNHHTKEIQERRKQLIAQLKPGAKGDSLPPELWNGLRPEKWRRLHSSRPAYTILAQMHRDLSEWVHPRHERWITVREAARLQSFHDGFVFKTSEWQMLKQIGNAVPPLLGRAAGMVARRALESCDGAWGVPEGEVKEPDALELAA
jgi:DNA (cytosine-5)-methyltransferase 1